MSDEMCAFLLIVCSLSVGIYLYVRWFILGKNRTRCFIEKAKKMETVFDYEVPIYYSGKNPKKCVARDSWREGEESCLVNILVTLFILFGLFRLLRFIF